jgi:hypothetical protein
VDGVESAKVEFASKLAVVRVADAQRTAPLVSQAIEDTGYKGIPQRSGRPPILERVVVTLFYALQYAIAYILMLIVMSYNIGLALAVLIGVTVGFFFFESSRTTVNQASCHL